MAKEPQEEYNKTKQEKPEECTKKRFHVRGVTIILILLFIFVGVKFTQQYLRIEAMQQEAKAYKVQYQAALDEQEKLKKQKDLLNDDDYVERLVREKLGLVKKGEILVVESEDSGDAVEYDDDIDPGDIH